MVIIASLVTSAVGFSAVLGALIAGMVIAETEYRGEVEVITAPFRGLGLGIFLITVGMSVDVGQLLAGWQALADCLAGGARGQGAGDRRASAAERSPRRGRRRDRRADGLAVGNDADRARLGGNGAADHAAKPRASGKS